MKIPWKKVLYFVMFLGSLVGFKNAVGQNDSIQNKNIESNLSENSFQISGVVRDSSDNSRLPFCDVILFDKFNNKINATTTDFDGKFDFKNLPTGYYKLSASFVGYKPISIDLISDKDKKIEILLSSYLINTDSIIITCYYMIPMIDKTKTRSVETFDSEQIKNMPIRR